jgi:hypothetical protein
MKDSFEAFVRKNRDAFDHREPSGKVWAGIEAGVKTDVRWWNSVVLWRVAAVLFMGLSVFLIVSKPTGVKRSEVAKLQGEFRDVESFYKDQIAEKVALIENYEDSYEDDNFTQDLQKLDAMYQILRDEMKTKPSEKVKDALVLNMLVRIDLLNQQIKKLEDTNKKTDSTVSI